MANAAGFGAGGLAFAQVEVGADLALDRAAGIERGGQAPARSGASASIQRSAPMAWWAGSTAMARPRGRGMLAAPTGGLPSSGARRKKA